MESTNGSMIVRGVRRPAHQNEDGSWFVSPDALSAWRTPTGTERATFVPGDLYASGRQSWWSKSLDN